MKILYHHRTMGRGAEGIHIASVVKAFESLNHKVIVVSPPGMNPLDETGGAPLDKSDVKVSGMNLLWKLISRKAPQLFFELLEILYNISAIVRIRKIIRKEKIDFLYERNAYFLFAAACISRIYNIPLAIEANEVVGIKRARRLILKRVANRVEQITFNSAKAIFVVSSFLKKRVQNIVENKALIYLTPNAIDPALVTRATMRDKIRAKYDVSDKTVLGFAGWFDWWDRLDLLVEVQRSLQDAGYRNVVTLLIGDGPLVNSLKEKTRMLNVAQTVIFVGPVERAEVIDYLDAIDIGVLPHSNEFGSPVVLFEMMALGKPVIAPSLMPINDVVTDYHNGLVFEPLDKEDLIKKISALIERPDIAKRIGSRARESVLNYHTWVGNAGKVIEAMSKNSRIL